MSILSVDCLFKHQHTQQFYEWLKTFEEHLLKRCGSEDMIPLEIDLITLSKEVMTRYVLRKGPIALCDVCLYGIVSYMLCFKYHIDSMQEPPDARMAVKAFTNSFSAFTLETYKATEWDMYEVLEYRVDVCYETSKSPLAEESTIVT